AMPRRVRAQRNARGAGSASHGRIPTGVQADGATDRSGWCQRACRGGRLTPIPMRQRRWEDVKSQSSRLHGNRIGSPWEEQEATDVLVPEIEGVVGRFYECPGGLSSTGRNTI